MRVVCLGGWCGPTQALSKLGLRADGDPLSPFEFVRCSMDAITNYTQTGMLDNFFPNPAEVDPVSIWLLFRGKHTCFTHFDIRKPQVQEDFRMRMQFYKMLLQSDNSLLFVRTAISCNPAHEIDEMKRFQRVLSSIRPPEAVSKIVLIFHDQRMSTTCQLFHYDPNLMLWSLEYDKYSSKGLFARSHRGYERILQSAVQEKFWLTKKDATTDFVLRCHQNLSHVEGVPIFTHNCIGYGTTLHSSNKKHLLQSFPHCTYCEKDTLHQIQNQYRWDSGRTWTAEEDIALKTSLLDTQIDVVQFIESFSNKYTRSARETLHRIEKLK